VALNGLVLGFGSVPPQALQAGVGVLGEVLEAALRSGGARRSARAA
jgi:hypothetical protein